MRKPSSISLRIFCLLAFICLTFSLFAQAEENYDTDALFIGDSLTRAVDWKRELPLLNTVNEGSPGIDTRNSLVRLKDILNSPKPRRVFIMLGINDMYHSALFRIPSKVDTFLRLRSPKAIYLLQKTVNFFNKYYWVVFKIPRAIANYRTIIMEIRGKWPNTEIFAQSILPIEDRAFYKNNNFIIDSEAITLFNRKLSNLAGITRVTFIDLYPYFAADHRLREEFTEDGIHLNARGNTLWGSLIYKIIYNVQQ